MFRLLKEALVTPERPSASVSSGRRGSLSVAVGKTPRPTAQSTIEVVKHAEDELTDLTDEDMLVEDTLEDLGRRTTDTKEDVELTFQVRYSNRQVPARTSNSSHPLVSRP
jgi:hypothetical protein